MVTFFKNDGTVAAAKQMLNSSDDDIKTAKERLSMIEEKTPLLQCNGGVFLLLPNQKECNKKFADYYNLRKSPLLKNTRYIIKLESFYVNYCIFFCVFLQF